MAMPAGSGATQGSTPLLVGEPGRELPVPRRPRFGIWHAFRNPPAWERPLERLYAETIEQTVIAEQLGFDSCWITEHHFCEDGYTPSPLVLLGAIAARTRRLRLGTDLIVPAHHHPVRLAEDAATVAILSGGRLDVLGLAAGYRALEFEGFGRSIGHRPSLLEESIEVIRRAWSGEPVDFRGRRFSVPAVRVTPVPPQPPAIFLGAHAPAAIERAARLADGFIAPHAGAFDGYLAALGPERERGRITVAQWTVVADDPERTWARLGPHAVYLLDQYVEWGAFGGEPGTVPRFGDPAAVLASGAFRLLDADAAIEALVALFEGCPALEDVHWWAQLPGEDVDAATERLAYLASRVLPAVRARLAPPAGAPDHLGGAR